MNKIRIAGIEEESIVDGPGIRLVVFTQGCSHNCIGCHNPETHSFYGGKLIDIDDIVNMIIQNPLLDGITLSGGEPFEQATECSILAEKVKNMGLNVVTYTGYTFEEILRNDKFRELLLQTDILIDGKFDISKKSMMLQFRGSTNQRIIDVKKYLGR
ncbi:anaerobic ribonucleoside-triphosphate reductase activating protein [Tissierella sp.]|uniref:anaerobic ribonucleoside-triphosphate reductase activating protein n=1 Tax=Tissierella sp. TaxID=41274 RepID=UPI0028A725F9|nr:anaerobic ribonucleoside-triphosphate reductase activating protein [Tissierella sp.]